MVGCCRASVWYRHELHCTTGELLLGTEPTECEGETPAANGSGPLKKLPWHWTDDTLSFWRAQTRLHWIIESEMRWAVGLGFHKRKLHLQKSEPEMGWNDVRPPLDPGITLTLKNIKKDILCRTNQGLRGALHQLLIKIVIEDPRE